LQFQDTTSHWTIKHTFQLPVLDNSAEKTASLVVNTCIVLSYPIIFYSALVPND